MHVFPSLGVAILATQASHLSRRSQTDSTFVTVSACSGDHDSNTERGSAQLEVVKKVKGRYKSVRETEGSTRVYRAIACTSQYNTVITHPVRLTIHEVIRAHAATPILQVTLARARSARERRSDAAVVVQAELRAGLEIRCAYTRHVAAVVIRPAGQRERATAAAQGAAVVVRAGVCVWADAVYRYGSRISARDDRDSYSIWAVRVRRGGTVAPQEILMPTWVAQS
jgi:hypothetical protein